MDDSLKTHFKEMAKLVNRYIETKEQQHVETLENNLKVLFDAEEVRLWRFNINTNSLELVARELENMLFLDLSLTNQAIYGKSCIYENHVTSNKYYSSKIDNPLNFKMKGLMIFPIIKDGCVIAVLKVSRSTKYKKTFSKKDVDKLSYFTPLLLSLLESKVIEKEELLIVLGDKKEDLPKKTESKKITNDLTSLEILEKKFEDISRENKEYHKNNKALQEHKEKFLELEHLYAEEKTKLESLEEKYKELETSYVKLAKKYKEHSTVASNLKKENINLRERLEKKNTKSIIDSKSEKSMLMHNNKRNIDTNIEHILQYIASEFSKNNQVYILFELILYTFHSEKGLDYIEKYITKSGLLEEMMHGYAFKRDLKIYNEKYRIDALVKHMKKCQNDIFLDRANLPSMSMTINIEKNMPTSLVIDAPKLQSIIFHLLLDLHLFVDYNKNMIVNIGYTNKILSIEFKAFIHSNNNFFKSMFKQKKSALSEKNRLGLKLSKEIIACLKGEIQSSYDDAYYACILTLPAQVIKI